MNIHAVGSVPTAAHFGLTDMMPAYIIINSSLDVLPTIDAIYDSGFEVMSWELYVRYINSCEPNNLYIQANRVNNATSIFLICWKEPGDILEVAYK